MPQCANRSTYSVYPSLNAPSMALPQMRHKAGGAALGLNCRGFLELLAAVLANGAAIHLAM